MTNSKNEKRMWGGYLMLIEKIKELLETEDPKNPLTDNEIAKKLGTKRDLVTKERRKFEIPDSRIRRKPLLIQRIKYYLTNNPRLSEREITSKLIAEGFSITRNSISPLRKELSERAMVTEFDKKDPFLDIIGCEGSLKNVITQAKAAIMYPPMGLNTIIFGPSGSGKSFLANKMHEFAVENKLLKEPRPFHTFNCADYADNPQFLLSQLFGYVKGAYTGADQDKKGLVELSEGGILFLDEVHRLPPEGQEILFYLLDKKRFRRFGESELKRKSNLLLIAATTEVPEESLLLTFRRRIPITIKMPDYSERTLNEKIQLIKMFFVQESRRVDKAFVVKKEVIKVLLNYYCPGNVGQLKNDIQATCAKAFLRSTINNLAAMTINWNDLPFQATYVNRADDSDEVLQMVLKDTWINPGKMAISNEEGYDSFSIYDYIEEQYKLIKRKNISEKEVESQLNTLVDKEINRISSAFKKDNLNYQAVENILGKPIMELTRACVRMAKQKMTDLDDHIIFPLAIHLNSVINRYLNGETLAKQVSIKKLVLSEFAEIANDIRLKVNETYQILLPIEENHYIEMYLEHFKEDAILKDSQIGVVVLSHGKVACGMAEVANTLLGVTHAVGLEMNLTDSADTMLEKTISIVEQTDQGKGVLILADMGSLVSFGDIITSRTTIPVRVIGRVDTLMVIEAVRRAMIPEDSLNEIVRSLDIKKASVGSVYITPIEKKRVFVTLCVTGDGAALTLKKYLSNIPNVMKSGIEIISVGYFSKIDAKQRLRQIEETYEILAIIGTIDPRYHGIRFYTAEEVLADKQVITRLVSTKKMGNRLAEVLSPELILLNRKYQDKNQAIDEMVNLLIEKKFVQDAFLLSVYKREAMMNTFLKGGIGIPHGESQYVTKPAIVFTKLTKPLMWENGRNVEYIFLLALTKKDDIYVEQLYRQLTARNMLNELNQANTITAIYQKLTQ